MSSPIEIFKTISKIPKCSNGAQKMRDFIVAYADELGYEALLDKADNILCRVGNGQNICLQAHYDMVCIGDVENMELVEECGFLAAKNSTLGADNCIGVSYMLALMREDRSLEYLFTADEEIGLIGAKNIDLPINSKYMINTDSENEKDIAIGCAGGYAIRAELELQYEILSDEYFVYELKGKNFQGGHSGFDIHKGIKSSIKEAALFLNSLDNPKIIHINGGEKLNSIPKEISVLFAVKNIVTNNENLSFWLNSQINGKNLRAIVDSKKLIDILIATPSGVLGYDDEYKTVCDSINLSIVSQCDEIVAFTLMGRSNTNDMLLDNLLKIKKTLELFGLKNIEVLDTYPAWEPQKSDFSEMVKEAFLRIAGSGDFRVAHAGFECGALKEKYPFLEIASIGPNIHNPHSLRERVEIASVEKVYAILKEIIANIKGGGYAA